MKNITSAKFERIHKNECSLVQISHLRSSNFALVISHVFSEKIVSNIGEICDKKVIFFLIFRSIKIWQVRNLNGYKKNECSLVQISHLRSSNFPLVKKMENITSAKFERIFKKWMFTSSNFTLFIYRLFKMLHLLLHKRFLISFLSSAGGTILFNSDQFCSHKITFKFYNQPELTDYHKILLNRKNIQNVQET